MLGMNSHQDSHLKRKHSELLKEPEPLEGKEPQHKRVVLVHVLDGGACCDSRLGRFAPIEDDHPMLQPEWTLYRYWKCCDGEWEAAKIQDSEWVRVTQPPFTFDDLIDYSVSLVDVHKDGRPVIIKASIEYHCMY